MRKRREKNYGSLCSVIRYLRTSYGWSQADLSMHCERIIRPNEISKIERGCLDVQLIRLIALSKVFGISIQTIIKNDFSQLQSVVLLQERSRRTKRRRLRQSAQKKKDFAGELGEKLIVAREKERLRGTAWENLVTDSFADDERAGFDIYTFTDTGEPLFIEVKSSTGNEKTFFISPGEVAFAQYCAEKGCHYQLIRVYNVLCKEKRSFRVYTAEEVLKMSLKVCSYIAEEE